MLDVFLKLLRNVDEEILRPPCLFFKDFEEILQNAKVLSNLNCFFFQCKPLKTAMSNR